jgi:hypothetical protein
MEKLKTLRSQINQPTNQPDAAISQVLLLDVYVQFNMYRAFSRPSSGDDGREDARNLLNYT